MDSDIFDSNAASNVGMLVGSSRPTCKRLTDEMASSEVATHSLSAWRDRMHLVLSTGMKPIHVRTWLMRGYQVSEETSTSARPDLAKAAS